MDLKFVLYNIFSALVGSVTGSIITNWYRDKEIRDLNESLAIALAQMQIMEAELAVANQTLPPSL